MYHVETQVETQASARCRPPVRPSTCCLHNEIRRKSDDRRPLAKFLLFPCRLSWLGVREQNLFVVQKKMCAMFHRTSGRRGLAKDLPTWQITCGGCKCFPIRGSLAKCETCNKQLCETCGESHETEHSVTFEFIPPASVLIGPTKPKPAD